MSININSQARRPMQVKAEIITVDSKNIACDGGGGQLGHPLVYLAINDDGQATCPYCGQKFVYKPSGNDDGH
ncbi:MAG: zinc-finger domain-containing protein [Pseudomonadota bacterium]